MQLMSNLPYLLCLESLQLHGSCVTQCLLVVLLFTLRLINENIPLSSNSGRKNVPMKRNCFDKEIAFYFLLFDNIRKQGSIINSFLGTFVVWKRSKRLLIQVSKQT